MYSTDDSGRYPTTLSRLTPAYLEALPSCPVAGRDTYSAGFRSASNPDAYTVVCHGYNHEAAGAGANHPQYNSCFSVLEK